MPPALTKAFESIQTHLPNYNLLSDEVITRLPHSDTLRKLRSIESLQDEVENILDHWREKYTVFSQDTSAIGKELDNGNSNRGNIT